MVKVLVLYYSMYGHIETMAKAVAERRLDWQGRQRVHVHSHPARRTGNYDHFVSHHLAASRHDHRGSSLFLSGDHEHE